MADLHFKETCPCGNSMDITGYSSHVSDYAKSWHHVHDKHANAIAKAIADSKSKPLYYVWPNSTWTTTTGGAVRAE